MKLFNIYSNIILIFTFGNLYKLLVLLSCYTNQRSYPELPWSDDPVMSKSSILWLACHLLISVNHTYYTKKYISNPQKYVVPFGRSQVVFGIIVISNCYHFLTLSTFGALAVNLGALLLLVLCEEHDNYEAYFTILTLPVLVQIITILFHPKTFVQYFTEIFHYFFN
jgi:hypothetical protein